MLFKKVKCKGYLKKINDGRFIASFENEGGTYDCTYMDTNNSDLNIECNYCGDLDFLKTYYEPRDKVFSGIIVGFKNIVATGYLTVDTEYDFQGREHTKFGKQPKDVFHCAVVYYANNRKRYVPVEKIEEVQNAGITNQEAVVQ